MDEPFWTYDMLQDMKKAYGWDFIGKGADMSQVLDTDLLQYYLLYGLEVIFLSI